MEKSTEKSMKIFLLLLLVVVVVVVHFPSLLGYFTSHDLLFVHFFVLPSPFLLCNLVLVCVCLYDFWHSFIRKKNEGGTCLLNQGGSFKWVGLARFFGSFT